MVLSLLPLLVLLVPPSSFASLSQNLSRPGVFRRKTLPAEAAAGLSLQNQPFTVVWNMPTANCQKQHNIKLDLDECDIVENRKQRFQGQVIEGLDEVRGPNNFTINPFRKTKN